jgi:amino acid permease
LIDLPKYYEANYKPGIIEQADWHAITFLQGFSICVFAFSCQNHILPLYGELEKLSTRRVYKVINRSVLVMTILYLTMGLAGYFSTFNQTPKIVLER